MPNVTAETEFIVDDLVTVPDGVFATYPFPLLSAHAVTFDPDKVSVDESAASNQI